MPQWPRLASGDRINKERTELFWQDAGDMTVVGARLDIVLLTMACDCLKGGCARLGPSLLDATWQLQSLVV